MAHHGVGGVVGARDDAVRPGGTECLPQGRRGLRQPEVHVAVPGQRAEQLDLGDGDPGVAEEREPGRQVEAGVVRLEPLDRAGVADVGRVGVDRGQHPPPQLGLPVQVVVERAAGAVGVAARAPVGHERGPLGGVGGVEGSETDGHGVAPVATQLGRLALAVVAEVPRERGQPRLTQVGVDRGEQRPHQALGVVGVVALAPQQQRDQGARVEEPDAGADPVAAARADPEPVGQPLREPPLDPLGGHHHHLVGERVVERGRQQLAEGVGELVGARSAVQVQGHRR